MTGLHPFRRKRYDAIIAGGRCAGAATAMLLARGGLDVLVVDRQPFGSDTVSTHALMRGAVRQLARWGLLPAIVDAGTPLISETTFVYGGEEIVIPIKPDGDVQGLYAPRRTVLDPILQIAAWDAGAEVHHGAAVMDLVRSPSGRVVGALVRDADGDLHELSADMVIGADGVGSVVARRSNAAVLKAGSAAAACIFGYVPNPGETGYRWGYGPGSGYGLIPTNDGEACLFASVAVARYDAELRGDPSAAYQRILAETDPELAALGAKLAPDALQRFRGRPGYIRQAFGDGWALVGDAGFYRDPITAHGITDALRDAEGLANAVLAGAPAAMDRYAAERLRLATDLLDATEAVAAYDWTLEEVKAHHKRFSSAMKAEMEVLSAREAAMTVPEFAAPPVQARPMPALIEAFS